MQPIRLTVPGIALLTALASGATATAAQEPPRQASPDTVIELPELTVPIGRLRVGAVPLSRMPFPVQVVERALGDGRHPAESLDGVAGVTLGNQTGSAAQPDLRVRGFVVSPVVGLPQSVSVFVDGVRVNEADASQVHLSLVPTEAVERIELLRGPVGAFGKNSLAGALNIVTRRGGDERHAALHVETGTFGTQTGTVTAGGSRGGVDGLVVGTMSRSDGWRRLEASRELSLFGKLGWRGERTDAWLSYTLESDSLEGPGPLPESWIRGGPLPTFIGNPPADPRELQYTGGGGDAFRSRLHFLNARVERDLTNAWSVQSTTFLRAVDFRQSNDNITEPDALGVTDILSFGLTAQATYASSERGLLVMGAEAVRNRVDIDIRELPNAAFPNIVPATTELLRTDEDNLALFAEAWWSPRTRLDVHASLRFDHTYLPVSDLLEPADSGENTFRELSGGIGLSYDLGAGLSGFAGYGRGFRAPVILEVSCADPDDPCQLPFELGPDPPLRPVTSDTWQAGLRLARRRLSAEVVGYWSEVRDDIFNVVDLETPTRGFFTNLERTRRVGTELSLDAGPLPGVPGLTVHGALAWTRATFRSAAVLSAAFLDDDDEEEPALSLQAPRGPDVELEAPEVEPGDRFPMVPAVSLRGGARYRAGSTVLSLEVHRVGSQILVGDEGNEAPFDRLAGYTIVDLGAQVTVGPATAHAELANVFDTAHNRFGIISRNVRNEVERVERFLTPGRPRAVSVGLRWSWGGS